jgi:hypothetical protein
LGPVWGSHAGKRGLLWRGLLWRELLLSRSEA